MNDLAVALKNAAEKNGFMREVFDDRRAPTHDTNIVVLPFFGDLKSTFVLSSLLAKRIKESVSSKYFIIASWPGHKGLYPYANEYWSFSNLDKVEELYRDACGFDNRGRLATLLMRGLNRYFSTISPDEVSQYYQNGLTDRFWLDFKTVERSFPSIPSATILGSKLILDIQKRPGLKVFIPPVKSMNRWFQRRNQKFHVEKRFWTGLVKYLLENDFTPVIYNNSLTYDLSAEFVDKCVYVNDPDLLKVMGAMRAIGCTLDIFSDFSKLALMARCPYVAISERSKFNEDKDYELDDLCGQGLQRQYIFSFPTIIESEKSSYNIYEAVVSKLRQFVPTIEFGELPPASESTVDVSYDVVRERNAKKLGTRFIKIPRERELDG